MLIALWSPLAIATPWAVTKPKLVVVIVIDQFRADTLSRYQAQFGKSGFKAFMQNGAYFPYGEYDLLQSMTGPGHATILSGAYPYQMGIPLNDWYDQATQEVTYCVGDKAQALVGTKDGEGVSPRHLIGTTVGDELKNINPASKVVTLALKDRAAVLLGGHRANLAFWFDGDSDRWISSRYYLRDGQLPNWLAQHNQSQLNKKCKLNQPCGAQVTAAGFIAALKGENLGRGSSVDVLAVSFSGHDYSGHKFGPDSSEVKDVTLAEDQALANMRAALESHVPGGLKNVLFVLTGDHGVAPIPESLQAAGVPSGRVNEKALEKEVNEFLNKKYGAPTSKHWITYIEDFNFYLSEESVRLAKADLAQVEKEIKEIALKNPGFAHVVTRSEFLNFQLPPGQLGRQLAKTFYRGRSGHVIGILKPFFINDGKHKANHMTGYTYDRMVPILFSGFGIKNGLFSEKAEVIDIAPTISFLLGLTPPALSEGRVLSSALK